MANHYSGKRVAGRKPVGKRALSLLMALVMSLSLVQITAFAVDTTGTTQKDAVVGTRGETMTYENGKVVLSKTVKKSTTGPNDFNITLEVTVKDETIQTPVSGASVVLVLDRSNSMENNFGTVQTAAKNFAKTLLKKGGNEIAVVGFGNNYDSIPAFTTDLEAANKAIDNATRLYQNNQKGGTNIQAGVYAAREAMEAATTDNKIIVIFSDGAPTFSYKAKTIKGTWYNCWEWWGHKWNDGYGGNGYGVATSYADFNYTNSFNKNQLAGDGKEYYYGAKASVVCEKHNVTGTKDVWANNGDPAILEAGIAKDAGATIYGVYLGNDENATGTMKKVATSEKHFYSTSNLSDLAGIFGGIVEEVVATQAGTVTDPMGEYIQLGAISNITGLTATEDGLTWNVGSNLVSDENGVRVYRVTYPITLLTGKDGFKEDWEYATNGKTTFSYTINNEAKTADFDVPTVKGYLPETVPPVVTETSYTVKHQYFINNERVDKGEVTTTDKGNVGATLTLEATDLLFKYGEKTYTDYKADPGMSIELDTDASKNVIVVSYYLTEEPEQTVNYYVVHQYYTNGVEDKDEQTMEKFSAKVGDEINATDFEYYEKGDYSFTEVVTELPLTVDAADTNNFIYVRYDLNTEETEDANYYVVHQYYTNGVEDKGEQTMEKFSAKVGDEINATDFEYYEKGDYSFTEVVTELPLSVQKASTSNFIYVRYDRTVEVEPEVRYTVLHEYYVKGADTAEARLVESFDAEPNQEVTLESIARVTQPSKLNENLKDYTYDFVSGTPDKLTVTADGDNMFVLRYERTVEINPDPIPTTYTVKHEYYTNGVRDDKGEVVDEKIAGEVGDEIGVTSCVWKQTYGGNNYGSPAATPTSIVLVADAKENVITLRYDRTTSTPVNPPVNPPVTTYDYYTVTVNYLDKDSGAVIHEKYSTTQREHTTYDVTAQDKIAIEGYTCVETTGDALTGTLNGNKVINVYYSKTTDIDDGDTPTTPAEPGSDIGDDDVPTTPAQPPKTGDSMGLWIAAALVSGMGLVWLALSGKKREERA